MGMPMFYLRAPHSFSLCMVVHSTDQTYRLDYFNCALSHLPNSLRVHITGIPLQGAKSRVETQIKLGIQLVNQQNERIGAWTHIKLPEYMVAKEKNKRINAKNVGKSSARSPYLEISPSTPNKKNPPCQMSVLRHSF